MKWLNKLERKFGRFAIKDLMTYIVVLNAVVFALSILVPESNLIIRFRLHPGLVMEGEVWRLITFILIPPSDSILWIVFALYFYYIVGSGLEQQWGSFKFNIYYFIGVITAIAAAFISGAVIEPLHLNLSLFLAFAFLFPNYEIRLFLLLPIKVKYLALFNWIFLGYSVIILPLAYKLTAIASVINFFLFFGKDLIKHLKSRKQVYENRKRFRDAYKK